MSKEQAPQWLLMITSLATWITTSALLYWGFNLSAITAILLPFVVVNFIAECIRVWKKAIEE